MASGAGGWAGLGGWGWGFLVSKSSPKPAKPQWGLAILIGVAIVCFVMLKDALQSPAKQPENGETKQATEQAPEPHVSGWLQTLRPRIVEDGRLAMMAVACRRLPPNITRGLIANRFSSLALELQAEPDQRFAAGSFLEAGAKGEISVEDNRSAACEGIDTHAMTDALDRILGLQDMWPPVGSR